MKRTQARKPNLRGASRTRVRLSLVATASLAVLASGACDEAGLNTPPPPPQEDRWRTPDERALFQLFRSTGGQTWTRSDNWLSDAPIGDWHGVEADTAGRVLSLDLSDNGLSGPIPAELGDLALLRELDLSGNALWGPMPSEMSRLIRLRRLSITGLRGSPAPVPSWLQRLTALESLDLSDNRMTGSAPAWLGRFAALESLDLSGNHMRGAIDPEIGALARLKTLRLNDNALVGPIPPEFGQLSALEVLDASSNRLTGLVPADLGRLTELTRLDLSDNALSGPIPAELGRLAALQRLDLSGNQLSGPIPAELANSTRLSVLALGWNELSGPIPPELGDLSSLVRFLARGAGLEGGVPRELGRLADLERLDLSLNSLVGPTPLELTALTDLGALDLTDNPGACVPRTTRFTTWLTAIEEVAAPRCAGDRTALLAFHESAGGASWTRRDHWGSERPLGDWHGVETDSATGRVTALALADNNLAGPLDRAVGDLAALERLDLSDNPLAGPIPHSLAQAPLAALNIGGTGLCAPVAPAFTRWLTTVGSVEGVDAECSVPTDREILAALYEAADGDSWHFRDRWGTDAPLDRWTGVSVDEETGRVTELYLPSNRLSGRIPPELGGLDSLEKLTLSGNELEGPVPSALGELAALRRLDLSSAGLTGSVPAELGRLAALESLELHGNQLSGSIPAALGELRSLARLSLADNGLEGPIPAALGRLGNLTTLDLSANRLAGPIPPELGRLAGLETLQLQNNRLTGRLPGELGALARLSSLSVAGNDLSGPLPSQLGRLGSLWHLALQGNRISGPIPTELGRLAELTYLDLSENALSGPIPTELGTLELASHIDLSRNRLSGPVPVSLARLQNLFFLHLGNNELEGPAPGELGDLRRLWALDLSSNRLSGSIPPELGRAASLRRLDLFDNRLSGPVPPGLAGLSELAGLRLHGNPDLTGPLPDALASMEHLHELTASDTGLCAPANDAFETWLDGILVRRIRRCESAARAQADAYLIQSVQSRDYPVPLVAGRRALLRVFMATTGATTETVPAIRATFHRGSATTHVAETEARRGTVGPALREGLLDASANAAIPGSVLQPGVEVVIEVDPDGDMDPALGIPTRIPERGRLALDVRVVPDFDLTVVPFLWTERPDSAIVAIADGMALDPGGHEMLADTRALLPVGTIEVAAHEPVATSSNDGLDLLFQTHALWTMEGRKGHYKGMMSGPVGGGIGGVAFISGRTSFSRPLARIVAHELGHNLGLAHAPCGLPLGIDPSFPDDAGRSGAWGYDWNENRLVAPFRPDLMSYCQPAWVSDYHFSNALRQRLLEEDAEGPNPPRRAPALLLWGGVAQDGTPVLNPAFAADLPLSLPASDGDWRIRGTDEDGAELFSLRFEMQEAATDGYRGGGFAFALPTEPGWVERLARLALTGPGGAGAAIDETFERPMAILRERATGRIRGFVSGRDLAALGVESAADRTDPGAGAPSGSAGLAGWLSSEPGVEILTSRGLPRRR